MANGIGQTLGQYLLFVGANWAARFIIGIGFRVLETWCGRWMMSSYLLMVASYLPVAFPLGGSVRIVQPFEDGVLTELLLYL